jgi:hypothetical protein
MTSKTATRETASPADVGRYFRRYGWTSERVDDHTFRASFRGKAAAFVALVRVTEHWVVFTVNPLLRAPPAGFGCATLRALALANHTSNLVKLGIDEDGDAFIIVELPSEGFSYAHFSSALGALSHAADALIVPLLQAKVIDERNGAQAV